MKLFKRKKEIKHNETNSHIKKTVEEVALGESNNNTTVKILGSGCASCNKLEEATKEALNEMGINCVIEHVTDFSKIASYGVMSTPALVVNEKVISYGKVLKKEEVIELLKTNLNN